MLKQTKKKPQHNRIEKGTESLLIPPPLSVPHIRADPRTDSPKYEAEVQLTSSWEANLGLAGGDRDPRCEVRRWLEGAQEFVFFSCQNPINQQVGHLWQRATATPLGQTAAKPTGFRTQRREKPKLGAAGGFIAVGTVTVGLPITHWTGLRF